MKRSFYCLAFFLCVVSSAFAFNKRLPSVTNLTLTDANTEYSTEIAVDVQSFLIKARTGVDIKVSFTSGQSGTTYFTVPSGLSYWEDDIHFSAATSLYIQSATAGTVVEIVTWK